MNISGALNSLRLLRQPALCLPHHAVSDFGRLPIPLSSAFLSTEKGNKGADIRAVVLDKDNCFSAPHDTEVWGPYKSHFERLKKCYPGSKLLIVSNTAGSSSASGEAEAQAVERNTGVPVLRHRSKKPGCSEDVLEYFRQRPDSGVDSPSQIAVVGDRLLTDVMLANLMGSYAVWIQEGITGRKTFFANLEFRLARQLVALGYTPPVPQRSR